MVKTVEAISTPLVSLDEMKNYLKLDDFAEDDDLVTSLIIAAQEHAEGQTGRLITSRDVTETFSDFQSRMMLVYETEDAVITYKSAGTETTIPIAEYYITQCDNMSFVEMITSLPSTDAGTPIMITYTSGYTTVPETLKIAVQKIVHSWYDNRMDGIKAFPTQIRHLLMRYTRW